VRRQSLNQPAGESLLGIFRLARPVTAFAAGFDGFLKKSCAL